MELQPILHVWLNHDTDLVDLTITTQTHPPLTASQHSEVVQTTQKHPFLTIEKGFLPVGQIKLGMHVLRADGSVGTITGWKLVPGSATMYNLEVAQDHTYTVGDGLWVVHNCAQPLKNGMKMPTNDALDAAHNFLGDGYQDLGNGRFVSKDGLRQVRMGDSDILGRHGGGPHMNFETLTPNPAKSGKMMIIENLHIYLGD